MAHVENDLENEISHDLDEPSLYVVIILNDDYTPFEFVINIISHIFNKTIEESENIAITANNNGRAVIDVFPKDIAETKVTILTILARENGYPLRAIVEKN